MRCLKRQKNTFRMLRSEEFNIENNPIYTTTYCCQTQYVVVLFFFFGISTKYYTKRHANNCEYLLYFHKKVATSCVRQKNILGMNTICCGFLLTKCNISAIIIYGRFGYTYAYFQANFKTIKIKKEGELCIR